MIQSDSHLQSFWDHANELRNTLIKSFGVILFGVIFSLFFYKEISQVLKFPLKPKTESYPFQQVRLNSHQIKNKSDLTQTYTLSENEVVTFKSSGVFETTKKEFRVPKEGYLIVESTTITDKLYILGPLDGMTTIFKVCFFVGTAASSPLWLFFILNFIAPALNPKFYRLIVPFIFFSLLMMFIGASLAFFITIPVANQYLELFNQDIGVNLWTLSNYLDYTILLLIGNAISFEMSVIAIFLVQYGLLSVERLKNGRRYFVVAAFILSAIFTPPDVLTQIMLAIPLIFLYECVILYAKLLNQSFIFPKSFGFLARS